MLNLTKKELPTYSVLGPALDAKVNQWEVYYLLESLCFRKTDDELIPMVVDEKVLDLLIDSRNKELLDLPNSLFRDGLIEKKADGSLVITKKTEDIFTKAYKNAKAIKKSIDGSNDSKGKRFFMICRGVGRNYY